MAPEDRPATHPVSRTPALAGDAYALDFFQALRRLECAHRELPRIGLTERPAHDPVRLAQEPSLAFAASSLARIEPAAAGGAMRLVGYFFGLLGPNGPLPLHLTEYVWERLHNAHDPTLSRFFDVFHHRMLSLFYRAWAINRPTVSFDRPEEDWFGVYVASLFGLGMERLRDRDALPDLAKLFYAGRLACQTRHPEGLSAMLAEYFRLPASIREFVGEWVPLPEDSRLRLGGSPDTGTLGETAIAGFCMWGAQHKFRVILGPIGLADYERFLPTGTSLATLVAMVRTYAGDALAWDLNLVLYAREVPPLQLGGYCQLGWTTWICAARFEHDADDLILAPPVSRPSTRR